MSERPPTDEIREVHIIDERQPEYNPFIEVFMEIRKNADLVDITAEVFPQGRSDNLKTATKESPNEACVRLLQPQLLTDEECEKYLRFAAVVGRLAYNNYAGTRCMEKI